MLAARVSKLITARARKNKRTARMLANARKDHSIPLLVVVGPYFVAQCWSGTFFGRPAAMKNGVSRGNGFAIGDANTKRGSPVPELYCLPAPYRG